MGVSWIEFRVSDLASLNFCWSLMLVISKLPNSCNVVRLYQGFFSALLVFVMKIKLFMEMTSKVSS